MNLQYQHLQQAWGEVARYIYDLKKNYPRERQMIRVDYQAAILTEILEKLKRAYFSENESTPLPPPPEST